MHVSDIACEWKRWLNKLGCNLVTRLHDVIVHTLLQCVTRRWRAATTSIECVLISPSVYKNMLQVRGRGQSQSWGSPHCDSTHSFAFEGHEHSQHHRKYWRRNRAKDQCFRHRHYPTGGEEHKSSGPDESRWGWPVPRSILDAGHL